jgi:hypothetical protein
MLLFLPPLALLGGIYKRVEGVRNISNNFITNLCPTFEDIALKNKPKIFLPIKSIF